MLAIGLMSGTSMDAVDVALVECTHSDCKLVHYRQFPIPAPLQDALRAAGPEMSINMMLDLDARVGNLFGACARDVMGELRLDPATVGVVGSHGQTLLHRPDAPVHNTLQIGDPNRIAWLTRVRTVADFRRMDMAAGGQGAPLASAFHAWRFRSPLQMRAVINIGGISNISIIPADAAAPVLGFDTGPGNTLLDQWIQRQRGLQQDEGGAWAATGQVIPELLAALAAEHYFQLPPPKSTGREFFNLGWLTARAGSRLTQLTPVDVQATLLALTVQSIVDALRRYSHGVEEVFICGGGVRNDALMRALAEKLAPARVLSTTAAGVPADAMEAMMIGWLAWRRVQSIAGNLPAVTGATAEVLLGAVYEPRHPEELRTPLDRE